MDDMVENLPWLYTDTMIFGMIKRKNNPEDDFDSNIYISQSCTWRFVSRYLGELKGKSITVHMIEQKNILLSDPKMIFITIFRML